MSKKQFDIKPTLFQALALFIVLQIVIAILRPLLPFIIVGIALAVVGGLLWKRGTHL